MIDVSRVKVGDELEFTRMTVTQIDGSSSPLRVSFGGKNFGWFSADYFSRHIPAPRPFEKGDPVTWGGGSTKRGTFIASHGGTAFFAHEDGSPDTIELSALRHADAAPEDEIVVTCEEAKAAVQIFYAVAGELRGMRAALTDFLKRRKESGR